MSRYDLESKTAGIKIAVGWDRPLNTYFGIVTEDKDDDYGDSFIVCPRRNDEKGQSLALLTSP